MLFFQNLRNVADALRRPDSTPNKWCRIEYRSNGICVPFSAVAINLIPRPSAYPASTKQLGRTPVKSATTTEAKCISSKIATFIKACSER